VVYSGSDRKKPPSSERKRALRSDRIHLENVGPGPPTTPCGDYEAQMRGSHRGEGICDEILDDLVSGLFSVCL